VLFAEELAQGEIGLLIHYLAEAAAHVDDVELRERIEALLHRLTDWTTSAETA
jgi:adenosyl cobinamide kinase/adenosyl cobinamide phosphate guanylyltransferase